MANAGDIRNTSSIPGLGRSPGEGNGNPLQYSCLENSMDRGAWQATVPGVTKRGMTEYTTPQIQTSPYFTDIFPSARPAGWVQNSAAPQAPLSVGFPRQEHWNGMPFLITPSHCGFCLAFGSRISFLVISSLFCLRLFSH